MSMKRQKPEWHYLQRFQEVICFLTLLKIYKNYKTLEAYFKDTAARKAYHLCLSSKLPKKQKDAKLQTAGIYSLAKVRNKKMFNTFVKLSSNLFTFHRHCTKNYKDKNKHFSRNSWFELDEDWLKDNFKFVNFNTKTCTFLSKDAHKWIDKNVFYRKKAKKESEEQADDKSRESRSES